MDDLYAIRKSGGMDMYGRIEEGKVMWDNGGMSIFGRTEPDYEDMILQRQEEQEIAEDMGYIFPDVIADCPYSDGGTCDGCTQGMNGGCYYG